MKKVLSLHVCRTDTDGIDANGSIIVNGGTIDGNFPNIELGDFIRESKNHVNPHNEYIKGNYFCLGDAESEEYGYGAMYCDNSDGSIIVVDWDGAYDCDFSKPISEFKIKLADSIEYLLSNIEIKI